MIIERGRACCALLWLSPADSAASVLPLLVRLLQATCRVWAPVAAAWRLAFAQAKRRERPHWLPEPRRHRARSCRLRMSVTSQLASSKKNMQSELSFIIDRRLHR